MLRLRCDNGPLSEHKTSQDNPSERALPQSAPRSGSSRLPFAWSKSGPVSRAYPAPLPGIAGCALPTRGASYLIKASGSGCAGYGCSVGLELSFFPGIGCMPKKHAYHCRLIETKQLLAVRAGASDTIPEFALWKRRTRSNAGAARREES